MFFGFYHRNQFRSVVIVLFQLSDATETRIDTIRKETDHACESLASYCAITYVDHRHAPRWLYRPFVSAESKWNRSHVISRLARSPDCCWNYFSNILGRTAHVFEYVSLSFGIHPTVERCASSTSVGVGVMRQVHHCTSYLWHTANPLPFAEQFVSVLALPDGQDVDVVSVAFKLWLLNCERFVPLRICRF